MEHYTQENDIRTIENHEKHFVWHRDKYDRIVRVISGEDWFLQMETSLPKKMQKHQNMYIQKEIWHRVFCTNEDATNNLIISIKDIK